MKLGHGAGKVVSIFALYSGNLSSNPAGYWIFLYSTYKRQKLRKKRPGMAYLKKALAKVQISYTKREFEFISKQTLILLISS